MIVLFPQPDEPTSAICLSKYNEMRCFFSFWANKIQLYLVQWSIENLSVLVLLYGWDNEIRYSVIWFDLESYPKQSSNSSNRTVASLSFYWQWFLLHSKNYQWMVHDEVKSGFSSTMPIMNQFQKREFSHWNSNLRWLWNNPVTLMLFDQPLKGTIQIICQYIR